MPTATKCAAPWSPAVKTSRPLRRTLRPALARESGSRGPSATDAVMTRLDVVDDIKSSQYRCEFAAKV
jgi:hypothetical protein